MLSNDDLLSHLTQLMSLHYLGKHEPWKLGLFSHVAYCVCFGLLYLRHLSTNFDNYL